MSIAVPHIRRVGSNAGSVGLAGAGGANRGPSGYMLTDGTLIDMARPSKWDGAGWDLGCFYIDYAGVNMLVADRLSTGSAKINHYILAEPGEIESRQLQYSVAASVSGLSALLNPLYFNMNDAGTHVWHSRNNMQDVYELAGPWDFTAPATLISDYSPWDSDIHMFSPDGMHGIGYEGGADASTPGYWRVYPLSAPYRNDTADRVNLTQEVQLPFPVAVPDGVFMAGENIACLVGNGAYLPDIFPSAVHNDTSLSGICRTLLRINDDGTLSDPPEIEVFKNFIGNPPKDPLVRPSIGKTFWFDVDNSNPSWVIVTGG